MSWLYDFQNLIAGFFALAAGFGAYWAGVHQARSTRQTAVIQIEEHQRQRKEGNQRQEQQTKETHRTIVRTLTFEYVSRADELIALLTDTEEAATAGLSKDPMIDLQSEVTYVRTVSSKLIRESVGRARSFVTMGQTMVAQLDVGDHAQHRISLIALEAALLQIERHLEQIDHYGRQRDVLNQVADNAPEFVEKLEAAKSKIPSAENPAPYPMPEVAYVD